MSTSPDTPEAQATGPRAWIRTVRDFVVLPREVTEFERSYLARMNRIAYWFFVATAPLIIGIAWLNGAGVVSTSLLTLAVLTIPTVGMRVLESERNRSLLWGVTSMCLGGVLVHAGQGPVQIEMHFSFFALLAMLAIFANPMVVVVGAATVAAHHAVLWKLAPDSVFNYDAPFWVVLVHAAFVVLETPVACFMARNFFDNVIGLERKVQARTAEVRKANAAMRLVLDNVRQGLVVANREGALESQTSEALEAWFGPVEEGDTVATYFERCDARFGAWLALGWESLTDGFLPVEVALDQLPSELRREDRIYSIAYEPVLDAAGELEQVLLVFTDITAEVAAKEASRRDQESLSVFQRVLADRSGLENFVTEATRLLDAVGRSLPGDPTEAKRPLHTLKGNSALFGLGSVADQCHALEDALEDGAEETVVRLLGALRARWAEVVGLTEDLLAQGGGAGAVVLAREEFDRIFELVIENADHAEIARELTRATLEPTSTRLEQIADQARALAERLQRGDIEVEVEDNDVRVERERFADFWMSFSHVVRNAIDHGLELPEERLQAGKPPQGRLRVHTFTEDDCLVVELADDGRGVDWGRVAQRARDLGVEGDERESLVRALFSAGVTTRDEVSDTSGRGVGLAAVKDAVDDLGGTIEVHSEPGQHTTFQFRFPGAHAVGASVTTESVQD